MQTDIAHSQKLRLKLESTLPILVFLLGIWYFCLRTLGYELEYIPGDFGDSRFINFLLEHGFQWLRGNTADPSFWNASFMYPFKNSIAISDNMLGTMPIYAIWRAVGFSTETSYQLWWITICAINFWSAFFVLKKWFNRWDLAIIGAWIFAFTIFNMGQLNYMQMIVRFMVPIVIYAAAKWVETSSLKYFALFSFGIVYQYYCVIYTGFFLMYFSLGFILIYAISIKKQEFIWSLFRRKNVLYTSIIGFISIASMLWLMLPYLEISKLLGVRLYQEVVMHIPVWQSFLFPQESAYLWHSFTDVFRPKVQFWWIQHTFAGIVPLIGMLALPIVIVYHKLRKMHLSKLTLSLLISTFLFFILFIRTSEGNSLYSYIYYLPGMNSIRVINRFMHVELFLIIAGLTSLAVFLPKKYSIALFLLVFIDNSFVSDRIIRRPKSEINERRMYSLKEVVKNRKSEHIAFAIIDPFDASFATHLDAMHVSLELNLPTINGYSSSCTGEFAEFSEKVNSNGLYRWLDYNKIDSSKVLLINRKVYKKLKQAY